MNTGMKKTLVENDSSIVREDDHKIKRRPSTAVSMAQ